MIENIHGNITGVKYKSYTKNKYWRTLNNYSEM